MRRFLLVALLLLLACAAFAEEDKVDLNTATKQQLRALPGIHDRYAERIIRSRPYTSKRQLVTRGVIPERVYQQVKERVIAKNGKRTKR